MHQRGKEKDLNSGSVSLLTAFSYNHPIAIGQNQNWISNHIVNIASNRGETLK